MIRRAPTDTGLGYGREAASHMGDWRPCGAWRAPRSRKAGAAIYEPFSIPLALSVSATVGPDMQAISDFPASGLAALAPTAPAKDT